MFCTHSKAWWALFTAKTLVTLPSRTHANSWWSRFIHSRRCREKENKERFVYLLHSWRLQETHHIWGAEKNKIRLQKRKSARPAHPSPHRSNLKYKIAYTGSIIRFVKVSRTWRQVAEVAVFLYQQHFCSVPRAFVCTRAQSMTGQETRGREHVKDKATRTATERKDPNAESKQEMLLMCKQTTGFLSPSDTWPYIAWRKIYSFLIHYAASHSRLRFDDLTWVCLASTWENPWVHKAREDFFEEQRWGECYGLRRDYKKYAARPQIRPQLLNYASSLYIYIYIYSSEDTRAYKSANR